MPEPKRSRVVPPRESEQRKGEPGIVESLKQEGDLNDFYSRETARAAREGNTEAAREVLDEIQFAIDSRSEKGWYASGGGGIHYEHARYLASALQKILAGDDPALALGIKQSKGGRRRGATEVDPEKLAATYWVLRHNDFTHAEAVQDIIYKLRVSEETIKRARTYYKPSFGSKARLQDALTTLRNPRTAKGPSVDFTKLIGEIVAARARRNAVRKSDKKRRD